VLAAFGWVVAATVIQSTSKPAILTTNHAFRHATICFMSPSLRAACHLHVCPARRLADLADQIGIDVAEGQVVTDNPILIPCGSAVNRDSNVGCQDVLEERLKPGELGGLSAVTSRHA
jgi:hypothetical protein